MTGAVETQTSSWWSGWASGPQGASLQVAAALPSLPSPHTEEPSQNNGAGPGGAVAQSRFMGRTALPIGTVAPVDGAPVISRSAGNPAQSSSGRAGLTSRWASPQPPAWPGTPQTCDGSGNAPGKQAQSEWEFNVDTWQWQHRGGDGSAPATGRAPRLAQHDISARRWGDGRDTLGAAALGPQPQAPLGGQGAAKRQRVVVTAVRSAASTASGFASLGGLEKQKGELAKAVLLPLRHPALFKRLGVDAVRGVLLHGPPGSGKTALARALAGEAGEGVHFELLNGGECVGGEDAGARMKRAFHTARSKAPSILFIDELDAVAPSRDASGSLSQAERQAGSQLLTLIDELRQSKAQVALLAATNRRQALDGSLRRAGRLDLEVSLGQLSQEDRLEVLRCATRGMPLGADVDLARIAQALRGYTAADCTAVCTEAALRCASAAVAAAEEQLGECGDLGQIGSQEFLSGLRVGAEHFGAAVAALGPAVLRGLCPEMPEVRWEDVGGLEEAKTALRELVEFPLRHGGLMQRMGLPPPRGALLYGPPGCGKTLLAKAAATGCGANFVSVRGPELLTMWLGESERAVRTLFETARCAAPCIIFFDELDSIAGRRGSGGEAAGDAAGARVLNQLLIEMDGLSDRGGVFVLAATNRPEALDPAIMRPGRFDHLVKVSLPDEASRLEILRAALRGAPLHPDVDLPALAAATEGASGADLAELCRRAGMSAIREWVAAEEAAVALMRHSQQRSEGEGLPEQFGSEGAAVLLTQEHLLAALGTLRLSVSARAAERYDDIEARLREGSLVAPGEEGPEEGSAAEEGMAAEKEEKGGQHAMEGVEQDAADVQQAAPRPVGSGRVQQQQLMAQLVRSTLDHSYASKARQLQDRVQLLEGLLRSAGLEVPPGSAPAASGAGNSRQ